MCVRLKVEGTTVERRTKVQQNTLDPLYKELFVLPLIPKVQYSAKRPVAVDSIGPMEDGFAPPLPLVSETAAPR